jgi:hypothetical protein
MSETRKLAAILVSDVVGYSRLAGADEERTLAPPQRPHRSGDSRSSRPHRQTHWGRQHRRIPERGRRGPLRHRGPERSVGAQQACRLTAASNSGSVFTSATWSRKRTAT